jgi:hypothetical protein
MLDAAPDLDRPVAATPPVSDRAAADDARAAIAARLTDMAQAIEHLTDLVRDTREEVARLVGERTAEQRAADLAARLAKIAAAPIGSAPMAVRLRHASIAIAILSGLVAILGGLGAAVRISVEIVHAVTAALTAPPH